MIRPTVNIRIVPATKLPLFSNSRFRKDAPESSPCGPGTDKSASPAIVASIQISVEPNQSLTEPRSSISCNVPTATLSVRNPIKSKFSRCTLRLCGMNAMTPRMHRQTDRQVDVEDPAPAVILGQPAAQHRPHDRAENRAHPEHRHRRAVPLRRVDAQQGRLRQRDQPGAGHPLHRAEHHQFGSGSSRSRTAPRRS